MKKTEIQDTICKLDGDLTYVIITHNHPKATDEMRKLAIKNLCANQPKIQEIYFAIKDLKIV